MRFQIEPNNLTLILGGIFFLVWLLLSLLPEWVTFKFAHDGLHVKTPLHTRTVFYKDIVCVEKRIFPGSIFYFFRYAHGIARHRYLHVLMGKPIY